LTGAGSEKSNRSYDKLKAGGMEMDKALTTQLNQQGVLLAKISKLQKGDRIVKKKKEKGKQ
jgi:hypothetical protein